MFDFPLWPDQASTTAWQIDAVYILLTLLSLFFYVAVALVMLYFAIKYRRGSAAVRTNPPHGNLAIELMWIVIPLGMGIATFIVGALIFINVARPPAGAIEMTGIGKQWMWKFQHPTGQREINDLHVPVGRPVKMTLASQDVIHSFFVPAFRQKWDVLPGRYTVTWFQATKPGRYHLHCTEYCGTQHADMGGWVHVMEPAEYESWLSGGVNNPASTAGSGQALFQNYGCSGCHGENAAVNAPRLEGVFGKPVALQNGSTVTADENYIRESILNPNAKIVAGYPAVMPSFQGQISEEDLLELVNYIKSLGDNQALPGNQPGGGNQSPGSQAPSGTSTSNGGSNQP
jgi:cytochrome c oxidase subunit 2